MPKNNKSTKKEKIQSKQLLNKRLKKTSKRDIEGYYVDDKGMRTLYKNKTIISNFLTTEQD